MPSPRALVALACAAVVGLLAACTAGTDDPASPSGSASSVASTGGAAGGAAGGATSASTGDDASSSPATGSSAATAPAAADDPFFLDTATRPYEAWQAATGEDKELLARIAFTPSAHWVTSPDPDRAAADVAAYLRAAGAAGGTGLLVLYAIPDRDCGSYSGGGTTAETYPGWVRAVAAALTPGTWVVLEPDALPMAGDCTDEAARLALLRQAALDLATAGGRVYVDAGHPRWLPAQEAADRLRAVGVGAGDGTVGTKGGAVRGFSLNVSNFIPTDEALEYGRAVARALGGGHALVDTSRNGRGSDGTWCNPPGRGLGASPRLLDDPVVDALVWVKRAGESDGTCQGGPEAGAWWTAQALEMARNADLTSAWAFREPTH